MTGGSGLAGTDRSTRSTASTCRPMLSASVEQVSPTDKEALVNLEEPADVSDPDEPFVPLGIDHEHASRGDDEVIEVSPRPRCATVME